ncbi:MAG: DUF4097 family beta strand repeat protein [Clostridiales bacterium]|nr:DUF4097 family beta strand repeat protein [Clostridiales bacterium]
MKDFDIKVKGNSNVTLFGTEDNTIVIPADCSIDNSGRSCDIKVEGAEVRIGVPASIAHIELTIADSEVKLHGISFDHIEIDASGSITVNTDTLGRKLDINMSNGQADLELPKNASFKTRNEGKNNTINTELKEDVSSINVIEINGKNSVLNIR